MLRITYQTRDSIRKSVLKKEFLKDDEFRDIFGNIFYKYAISTKKNFFIEFFRLPKILLFILSLLHFKISSKKN